MFGLGIVVLVAPAAVAALVVTLALLAASARPDTGLTSEVASARRHAVSTSALAGMAAAAAVVLSVVSSQVDGLGLSARGQACIPLGATAVALVVLAIGELTWPRPRGATRTAVLNDRSAATVLPRGWTATAVGLGAVTVVSMVLGGVLGAGDGRSITRSTATTSSSAGPFPGWYYVVPQLAALVVCLALVLMVARTAVRRSSVVTASVDSDRLLRQASAARAMRALVTGVLVTLGADLVLGGAAAAHVLVGLPRSLALTGLVLGLVSLVAALVASLVPVPRLPAADPLPAPARLPG